MSNQTGIFYKRSLIAKRNELVEALYHGEGMSLTDIAFIFKVSKQMISKIILKTKNKNI